MFTFVFTSVVVCMSGVPSTSTILLSSSSERVGAA